MNRFVLGDRFFNSLFQNRSWSSHHKKIRKPFFHDHYCQSSRKIRSSSILESLNMQIVKSRFDQKDFLRREYLHCLMSTLFHIRGFSNVLTKYTHLVWFAIKVYFLNSNHRDNLLFLWIDHSCYILLRYFSQYLSFDNVTSRYQVV